MRKVFNFKVFFLIVALTISFFGVEVKAYYLINSHKSVSFTTSSFSDLTLTLDKDGSYASDDNLATEFRCTTAQCAIVELDKLLE